MRDFVAVREIFLASWINLLLVCIPLGFASEAMGWGAVATFSLVSLSRDPRTTTGCGGDQCEACTRHTSHAWGKQ